LAAITTRRILAALCLCVAGAAVASLLLMQHHGERFAVAAVDEVCGNGQTSGCDEVARSPWSSVAGVPLAAVGLAFYLSLALLLALGLLASGEVRDVLAGVAAAGLALGLLVDLFLLGVQVFSIRTYCSLCILTYLLSAAALVALLPARRGVLALGRLVSGVEGRLALAGWVLGTLTLAGGLFAADATLTYREEGRQARLLGAPSATPAAATSSAPVTEPPVPVADPSAEAAPVPTATPAGRKDQDAAYWRERAEQLQATLDDPRKLDAYFSEKARREYASAVPVKIEVDDAASKGPVNAPVRVVEFSDFLCPFCRNLAGALAQFIPQAGGRVVVFFKNYPLDAGCNPRLKQSTHPGSCNLALGAVCAEKQGKFAAYHDKVFSTELRNPQITDVVRLAGEAGLSADAMSGCLEDPATRKALDAEIAEGNRLGVAATPTLYINGRKLPRINDFVAVVDKEAQKKGFPPLGQ
jgi:protein-disulfide isomerase/uncharacterized membrane protein